MAFGSFLLVTVVMAILSGRTVVGEHGNFKDDTIVVAGNIGSKGNGATFHHAAILVMCYV